MVIGDFNGHVGMERTDLERWHGGHSYDNLNDEGRAILQYAQMYDFAICNTFFPKERGAYGNVPQWDTAVTD